MFFDTVKLAFHCQHKPFGKEIEYGRGTEHKRISHQSVSIAGSFNKSALKVLSARNGELLIVEGSFPRYLQGHNVFGSGDLLAMTGSIFKKVTEKLEIRPSKKELRAVEHGAVEPERLDYTRFALTESDAEVRAALTALRLELPFRTHDFSCYGLETVYVQQHSSKWTLKFYDKGAELRIHPLPEDLPCRGRLLNLAGRLLRIELTLRQDELRRLGIHKVADVQLGRIDRIFHQRLRDLNLRRIEVLFTEPPGDLQTGAKLAREIYLLGGDPLAHVPPSTRSLYRKVLMDLAGLDVRTPKEHADAALKHIDLREVFSEKLRRGNPAWAKKAGLIWGARSKGRSAPL